MDNLQRIKTEGPRINPLRNVERLWLEVEAVGNGCSVETHKVLGEVRNDDGTTRRQVTRIEIYADRLNAVLTRTRTDKERRVWEQACESAQFLRDEWLRKNHAAIAAKKNAEERARFIHYEYSLTPAHELPRFGYPTGLPPIEVCKVIHPHTLEAMDAREWLKMPAEKRAEWHVSAPITPENAAQRSNENLAQQIGKAIAAGIASERKQQK